MVATDAAEPTKQQIKTLHTKVLQEIATVGEDQFQKYDLARLKNEAKAEKWMRRFLMHQDCDLEAAFKMVMKALKVRSDYKVDDIKPEDFGEKFLNVGGFFPRGRDTAGCRVFVIKPKTRTDEKTEDLKKLLLYWFDRLERESDERITVFIELTNCGVSSMDLDFTAFLVACLQEYYPFFLNWLIMFEMPWILNSLTNTVQRRESPVPLGFPNNDSIVAESTSRQGPVAKLRAVWKIIKSWLPPKSIAVVKFLDRKSLPDYIAPDQALVEWAGRDAYKYTFIPEANQEGSSVPNGYGGNDDPRRKVHFADGETGSMDTETSDGSGQSRVAEGQLVKLKPSEEIIFHREENETSGTIVLSNVSLKSITYKIKITSPDKFSVRPSTGVLEPDASVTVAITVKAGYPTSNIVRDKFLVMAFELDTGAENPTSALLAELWRVKTDQAQHFRLKCSLAPGDANDQNFQAPAPAPVKQYDEIAKKARCHKKHSGSAGVQGQVASDFLDLAVHASYYSTVHAVQEFK